MSHEHPQRMSPTKPPFRHASVRVLPVVAAAALLAVVAAPVTGQQPAATEEPELPGNVVVDVDMVETQVFRIGIPDLLGAAPHGAAGGGVMRNDFTLMPGYRVIDPRSVRHDLEAEGLGLMRAAWGALSASGVIKGQVTERGGRLEVEMRYFHLARGSSPALERSYSGEPSELRGFMHDFGNEVLRVITGVPGPFGTHLAYSRREGPGRKDIWCAAMDGFGARRVSNGRGIAMLPAWDGEGNLWFTRLMTTGMWITRTGVRGRQIIAGDGLNMAPAICNGRVYFVSSRQGNSEIYSARPDGSDVRRLTSNQAIDVSPACGPDGRIAFVSARQSSPQIFVMNADGSDQRRVTFRGSHNQTPTWCPDPSKQIIAFTGRSGGLDVFTMNLATQEYTRLTQGQGSNKDPAFSPDCRIIAFSSDRRRGEGIYLSSPQGFNQQRVLEGNLETVRWLHTGRPR